MNVIQVALDQHFGHAAVPPKLPSIWKGGCASKKLGRCVPPLYYRIWSLSGWYNSAVGAELIRVVAVQQACPEVYFQGPAPAGSGIPPYVQGLFGRSRKFRRGNRRYLMAGMQPKQVRHVRYRVNVFPVFVPLLQITLMTDVEGVKLLPFFHQQLTKFRLGIQHGRRINQVSKQIPHDRHIHRCRYRNGSVLSF